MCHIPKRIPQNQHEIIVITLLWYKVNIEYFRSDNNVTTDGPSQNNKEAFMAKT